MSSPDADWDAFRAARERFFARVRPEAMEDHRGGACPDVVPADWPAWEEEARQRPRE